jgi:hypothetical protein
MVTVTAIQNFDHGDKKRRGDVFEVSDPTAQKLKARGLVVIDGEAHPLHPTEAAGVKLSALPAAQALPQTIAKKSGNGGKKKQDAPLSVPIRHLG